jgi:VWFA-related protein
MEIAMSRVLLLLVAATGAFGQSGSSAGSPQRLVRLSVAATDAKGEPITDLQAADIQVREDGQARPAVFFRFAGPKRAMLPPAQGEIANRPAPAPTVILIDRWNERILTAASAWVDLSNALQHTESVERIFIYFLTNHGDLFPVEPLRPGEAEAELGTPALTPADLRAKLDQAVRKLNGFRDVGALDPIVMLNTTLQGLYALGGQMASIAGRKNLIWITHGFPLTMRLPGGAWADFTPQVRRLSAAAVQSGIAIYAVDQSSQGAGADPSGVARETLQMFASLTGGRLFSSDNAAAALAAATADGRGSYRLAYYSPIREKDKKEHKIRLESLRRGVRLLTRESYFGDAAEPDPAEEEKALFTNECGSPFDATEIGLRVALSASSAGQSRHFAIRVDPADVLLEQRGGDYQGELALLFALYSQGSLKEAAAPTQINVRLTPDQFSKAQKDGIDVSQDVPVSADIEKIRVIVLDRRLGALGSVTVIPGDGNL